MQQQILELIKSGTKVNDKLAKTLMMSLHGMNEEAAQAIIDDSIREFLLKTFISIEKIKDGYDDVVELHFYTGEYSGYEMLHYQDCCERVWLEDVVGDLDDLIGNPIIKATKTTESKECVDGYESVTYTFYNLATIKGHVTLRWIGQSNGYYSEEVHIGKFEHKNFL